jgi:hypothetical protein
MMADDLVKRLRLISAWKTPGGPMPTEDMVNPHITCDEAADRIERLETVLRDLLHFEMAHVGPYAGQKVIAARAALEGKDAPA